MASGFSIGSNVFLSCTQFPREIVSTDGDSIIIFSMTTNVWAPAIAVIWKSGDFITTTQHEHSTITTTQREHSTITAIETTSITFTPPNTSPPPDPHHAIIIVIATVVPAVLIFLFVLAFIFYRRRARRVPAITQTSLDEIDTNTNDPPNSVPEFWPAPVELSSQHAREMEVPVPHLATVALPVYPTYPIAPRGYSAASTHVAVSAAAPQDDDEIEWLEHERQRVNERRERLLTLDALEEEDRQLQRRIQERRSGTGSGL